MEQPGPSCMLPPPPLQAETQPKKRGRTPKKKEPKEKKEEVPHTIVIPGDLNDPPRTKRPKQNPLSATEKETVLNIYKLVRETWPIDVDPWKKDMVKKTAEIVGISRATVYNIMKEFKKEGCVRSPPPRKKKPSKISQLDDNIINGIRAKVHMFFSKNEVPTLDKVLTEVNNDTTLPNFSRSSLYRILKDRLKFKYAKRVRKSTKKNDPNEPPAPMEPVYYIRNPNT